MKQTQRHNGIIELVKQQGYVSTEELVEHFSVSPQTIRRDLNELAKQGLLDALHKYGCLPKRAGHKASLMSMTPTLNRGLQRYIADSNSALLGLQPEDWLDMAEPVNIPGTSYQYKNWRRKLSATLESMFADDGVNKLLKDLDRRRRAAAKKK